MQEHFSVKYLTVWPSEKLGLQAVDQDALYEAIDKFDFSHYVAKRKPVDLKVPCALDDRLNEAHRLGHSKVDVLLKALREYRRRNPWEDDWKELPHKTETGPKVGGSVDCSYRLLVDDACLVKNIGRGCAGVFNRFQALLEAISIVDEMKIPDVRKLKKIKMYYKMKQCLSNLVDRRKVETGLPWVQILLRPSGFYVDGHVSI